jgi:hypothetical protein
MNQVTRDADLVAMLKALADRDPVAYRAFVTFFRRTVEKKSKK